MKESERQRLEQVDSRRMKVVEEVKVGESVVDESNEITIRTLKHSLRFSSFSCNISNKTCNKRYGVYLLKLNFIGRRGPHLLASSPILFLGSSEAYRSK